VGWNGQDHLEMLGSGTEYEKNVCVCVNKRTEIPTNIFRKKNNEWWYIFLVSVVIHEK